MGFFDDIADAFSKNGAVTRFCENIPVVGHATAGIQALAGNTEEAKRGLATSTGNLCSAVGAVAGMAGGPVGAAAGGALGGLVGSFVTAGLASTIDDPNVRGDLDQISAGKIIMDVGLGAASGLLPGSGSLVTESGKSLSKEVVKEAGKDIVKVGVSSAVGQGLKGLQSTPQVQYGTGESHQTAPGPEVDPGEKDPKKKTKLISQHNEDKIGDCIEHLRIMNITFSVTAVGGPASNTMVHLETIKKGQLWAPASLSYQRAWENFDAKFAPSGPGSEGQGGKPGAIEELLASGGITTGGGQKIVMPREELQSLLDKAEETLMDLRGKANHSIEYMYDEAYI